MRNRLIALGVFAALLVLVAALVVTLTGTVTLTESVQVSAPDLTFALTPNQTVTKQATFSNTSSVPVDVVAFFQVSGLTGPASGVSGIANPDLFTIPALGSVVVSLSVSADNGADTGVYDGVLSVLRPVGGNPTPVP